MTTEVPIAVPDIGDFDSVDVIDILVSAGDVVAAEDPLITLESEKATMDIPAPFAGTVDKITVVVGDKVSEGSLIAVLATASEKTPSAGEDKAQTTTQNTAVPPSTDDSRLSSSRQSTIEVAVPDIGDFDEVDVIDVLVHPGDTVALEDPLITLESEKATMDIPAPVAGQITDVLVAVGDKVSEGHLILNITSAEQSAAAVEATGPGTGQAPHPDPRPASDDSPSPAAAIPPAVEPAARPAASGSAYASPSVRKFARELGVDLTAVSGTGRKGRIIKTDVQQYVKSTIAAPRSATNEFSLPSPPDIDFSKFGPVETSPLTNIKKLTARNMQRSWLSAPHVTQFDEADITELEAFRKSKLATAEAEGVKLTLLSFLVKAVVTSLQKFPDFNASLSADGESLIRKQYYHIGIAANTDRGLLVPVIKDADQKGLFDLAGEIRELSTKARERKIQPSDMQGASFTISNLGGVGGTAFTPIINVPEVAILGVSPAVTKPLYINNAFEPRLMLPFALSFDHRVIDGVAGAEFTRFLGVVLGDIRHILL